MRSFFSSIVSPALALSLIAAAAAALPALAADREPPAEYYFLILKGKAVPVKQVLINGKNVLGGSVISLSMPINVTSTIQKGLNEVEVDLKSDDKMGLTTVVERRTPGPKRQEVAKLEMEPGETDGKLAHKTLSFNVMTEPTLPGKAKLADSDRDAIKALVLEYYDALKSKNAGRLRSLYSASLKREKKICPESARFFSKVLDKEITLLRRPDIKIGPFSVDDIMMEVDNDRVKVLKKDRKPLIQSNEIELKVEPIISEVGKGKKDKTTVQQRLVTTKLIFRKIDDRWQVAIPAGV